MKIAIIDSGYIGQNLGRMLNEKGYKITATTSDITQLEKIEKYAAEATFLKNTNKEQFIPIIEENDKFVITISDNGKDELKDNLLNIAQAFKQAANEIAIPKTLIYTSRTSVYGNNKNMWVDENTEITPATDFQKKLVETEKIFLSLKNSGWTVIILRIAEVYGPSYEIKEKYKNRSDYFTSQSKNSYTNMVHLDDILNVCKFFLEHDIDGIFNVVDDDHISLKELIDKIEQTGNFGFYDSIENPEMINFKVSNYKLKSTGYKLMHPTKVIK